MKTLELPTRLQNYSALRIDPQSVLTISENSWWVSLDSGEDSVEGKLHLPAAQTTKLIIFEPGFPGGASTDFERLHLSGLLSAGYAIFAARHRGTILNGKHSDYYINCKVRQDKAQAEMQIVLGNGDTSLIDWLEEPIIAFDCLSSGFDKIILVGQSFGAMAVIVSAVKLFKRNSENVSTIKHLVSLAGVTGRVRSAKDPILEKWEKDIDTESVRERIQIGDPEENRSHIREAHKLIHQEAGAIPPATRFTCLSAWGDTPDSLDELIAPQEALDIIVSLGRGTLIIDKTQRADQMNGVMAHELFALKTEHLLKFIDPNWVPPHQILRLDDTGIH